MIDGYNGIACEKNSVEQLVEATSRLIEDKDLRDEFAVNARTYAEMKDWNKTFDNLLEMLQKVIDTKVKKKRRKLFFGDSKKTIEKIEEFLRKYDL